ncbi:hypothetical protein SD457_18990 [Coprobacillaceae bacterium CR2/5/TPMF4]|nr:hypothetical protein SD457_18990 [Coprobacillaceae bacterium CR2/5/TPMF4]
MQQALEVEHLDHIQILAMMTRLRQLCCDARILYNNIDGPSSKMSACLDIIKKLKKITRKYCYSLHLLLH